LEVDVFNLKHITTAQFAILKKYLYTFSLVVHVNISEANVFEMVPIASDLKLQKLTNYCITTIFKAYQNWDIYDILDLGLNCSVKTITNFAKYHLMITYQIRKDEKRFQKLDRSIQNEIERNSWPGPEYWEKVKNFQECGGDYYISRKKQQDSDKCIIN